MFSTNGNHAPESAPASPSGRTPARRKVPRRLIPWLVLLCCASAMAIVVRARIDSSAWDVSIYLQAVHSIQRGHDPYADAIAIQQQFHREHPQHPNGQGPFSYVYSPITLPALYLVAALPLWISGMVYWSAYLLGLLAQIYSGLRLSEPSERNVFLFFAPIACFFPGFLASDILWSGNVAFILYGLMLVCAVPGWKRNDWKWFYLAVLLASCVKAPLLTLLAVPIFSGRRQWLRSSLTAAAGLALFALQPLVWPSLFRNYLEAVELQFSYNRDFGSSPAGLFSGFLFDHGIPYSPAGYIFYLAYALPLAAVLFYLSRRFLRGDFTLSRWLPVLYVGVVLFNPRILEYDEILLALPLALIAWRFFAAIAPRGWAVALSLATFLSLNVFAYQSWSIWKLTEGPLLVVFFSAGCWTLLRPIRTAPAAYLPTADDLEPEPSPVLELQNAQSALPPLSARS